MLGLGSGLVVRGLRVNLGARAGIRAWYRIRNVLMLTSCYFDDEPTLLCFLGLGLGLGVKVRDEALETSVRARVRVRVTDHTWD